MKKVMASLTLFSLGLLVAPVSVKAADEATNNEKINGQTDVTIDFVAGETNIAPVDPNDPSKTIDPAHDNGGAISKPIENGMPSLIYVSPTMNFFDDKSHNPSIDLFQPLIEHAKVSSKKVTQIAIKSNDSKPYDWDSKFVVEVADGRGANAQWKLQVTGGLLSKLGGETINGAKIAWPKAFIVKKSGNLNEGPVAESKEGEIQLDGKSSAQEVLTAGAGEGGGVTAAQFEPADIKLTVPANSAKPGAYSTKLNWTLSDTPQE